MKRKMKTPPSLIPVKFQISFEGKPTRIKLANHQTIHLFEHHYHDEGWSSCHIRIVRHDDIIYETVSTDGRDCDGRMTTESKYFCHRKDLRSHWYKRPIYGSRKEYSRDSWWPKWTYRDGSQRDFTAEAAGY